MTSERILFPQFRDEQAASKYPFADSVALLADSGFKIDPDTFVDASFYGIGMGRRVYLSAITITAQTTTFTVRDAATSNQLTGSYKNATPPENGVVALVDSYGRPAGMLLAASSAISQAGVTAQVSALAQFSAWSLGTHNFTPAATEFVATVVIPANEPGVRGLSSDTSSPQTGDIWLVGKNGIVLRVEDENVVRVDIVGVPLFERFVCAPQTEFKTTRYLQTINGCGPDKFGNFIIMSDSSLTDRPALRVYPENGTLTIKTIGPQVS